MKKALLVLLGAAVAVCVAISIYLSKTCDDDKPCTMHFGFLKGFRKNVE